LVERIQNMTDLKYDQCFKLALLLTHNNSTSCQTKVYLEQEISGLVGKWEPLLWKKLASLASDKLVKFEDTVNYNDCCEDEFSLIETALPFLDKFTNLKILIMSGTAFHDEHLVQLAQKVPNLRSLTFEIDKEITNTGLEALTKMEKLEELLYDYGERCYSEEMGEFGDKFTTM